MEYSRQGRWKRQFHATHYWHVALELFEPTIEDEDNVIPVIGERGFTGVPQRGQIRIQLWW